MAADVDTSPLPLAQRRRRVGGWMDGPGCSGEKTVAPQCGLGAWSVASMLGGRPGRSGAHDELTVRAELSFVWWSHRGRKIDEQQLPHLTRPSRIA